MGLNSGADLVSRTISNGTNIIMFGEMGIGNTSSVSDFKRTSKAELRQSVCWFRYRHQ
ncbi:nicotinate-nucleotide--dimethylbenzimidazole phosphoribosyltransferase [Vibrio chagasii]|nr:nicotinate-nucleotide--dimethylbenzimidazole phosphoribosyltransferase [Vibrio chagasii]